jgi:hypothetical protein
MPEVSLLLFAMLPRLLLAIFISSSVNKGWLFPSYAKKLLDE